MKVYKHQSNSVYRYGILNKILHKSLFPTIRMNSINFKTPETWYWGFNSYWCSIFKPILFPQKATDIGHLINEKILPDILIPDSLYSLYRFFLALEHGDAVLSDGYPTPPFKVYKAGTCGQFIALCNLNHPEISLTHECLLIDEPYYLKEIKPRYEK